MKTISPIIFLICLLAACSPENTEVTQFSKQASFALKDGTALPNNPANTYDFIGIAYTNLLDNYYALSPNTSSLQQVITQGESLAFQNPGFLSLADSEGYTTVTVPQVQAYLQPQEDITELLSSGYGEKSRTIFMEIVQNLASLKQSEATYQQVYDMLASIEALTIGTAGISDMERAGILTTNTILRNALYHDTRRKRRDRDWEWMIGNIAATANEALDSKADAMMISFATDVYFP
jgi:hypothetical protein